MSVKIKIKTIENSYFTYNAMSFIPTENIQEHWAIFTHGYTSCKKDNLTWAQRLSEAGIPCVIFDLPGHYLGSFHECNNFDHFKDFAHLCFVNAFHFLRDCLNERKNPKTLILGGHSLGALLAIKALEAAHFQELNLLAIGVGLGISQHQTTHLFETSFYQKTLNIRRQLVSPALDSDNIFPWIKDEKENINIKNKKILLLTGIDDVVVGKGGMQAFEKLLIENNNTVTSIEPQKLPHHEPSLAAPHIYHYLKKELKL